MCVTGCVLLFVFANFIRIVRLCPLSRLRASVCVRLHAALIFPTVMPVAVDEREEVGSFAVMRRPTSPLKRSRLEMEVVDLVSPASPPRPVLHRQPAVKPFQRAPRQLTPATAAVNAQPKPLTSSATGWKPSLVCAGGKGGSPARPHRSPVIQRGEAANGGNAPSPSRIRLVLEKVAPTSKLSLMRLMAGEGKAIAARDCILSPGALK